MARSQPIPTFLVAAMVLVAAILPGTSLAQPGTARPCRDLQFPLLTPPAGAPAAVGPPIAVPVIVHFMKTTDPRHAANNDLQTIFTRSVVLGLFAPSGAPQQTVNVVWRRANIRLALHRAEECDYDPLAFEIDAPDREEVPSPMAGAFGADLFNKINSAFNFGAVRGLDLYLWMDIKGGLVGYGASHRQTSPRRVGAVWIDKGCWTSLGDSRCAFLVAHEIGHFLGLCHSCDTAMTASGPCPVCLPPGTNTAPPCAGAPPNFIMRGTYDGILLTPCEIGQARTKAVERINTP